MLILDVLKVVLFVIPMQIALHAKLGGLMILKIKNANRVLNIAKDVQRIQIHQFLLAKIVRIFFIRIVLVIV